MQVVVILQFWLPGILFYGTVTLVLKKEICSEVFAREEEATESAYMKLAHLFGLKNPEGGR